MVKKRNISNSATIDVIHKPFSARKPLYSQDFGRHKDRSAPALQLEKHLTLKELLDNAKQSIPYLEEAMEAFAAGLDVIIEDVSLKNKKRAEEKLKGECHGIPALLTDLVRGRIVADNFHTLKQLIDRIYNEPESRIPQIHNRFEKPNERNHRDFIFKIILPNKHVAEIQIHHTAILQASEKTHGAYQIIRRLNERCTLEDNRFLTDAEQEDYINNIQICIDTYARAVDQSGLESLQRYPLPFPRYIMPAGLLNLLPKDKEEILLDTV